MYSHILFKIITQLRLHQLSAVKSIAMFCNAKKRIINKWLRDAGKLQMRYLKNNEHCFSIVVGEVEMGIASSSDVFDIDHLFYCSTAGLRSFGTPGARVSKLPMSSSLLRISRA